MTQKQKSRHVNDDGTSWHGVASAIYRYLALYARPQLFDIAQGQCSLFKDAKTTDEPLANRMRRASPATTAGACKPNTFDCFAHKNAP